MYTQSYIDITDITIYTHYYDYIQYSFPVVFWNWNFGAIGLKVKLESCNVELIFRKCKDCILYILLYFETRILELSS